MFLVNKINAIVKRSRWYNFNAFLGCRKFWQLRKFDLEVVNLGSSASYYAFDYSAVAVKGYNFALPSQYLLADYEILRNYFSFLKPGATVILGTCLFPLDGYDVTYFDDRYYTLLTPPSIWHFSSKRQRLVLDIKNNPIKYYPIFALLSDIKHLFCKEKSLHYNKFQQDSKRWILNWANEFSIDDFNNPLSLRNSDLLIQAIDIVRKLKDFCDNKGFRLVMVQAPVSPDLKEWLSPSMRNNYIYALHNSETLKDIEYYDYLDDKDFINRELFSNAYILNNKGAKLFTHKVLKDIKLIK